MNTHIVTKRLPIGSTTLEPGTEVDASDWPKVKLLEEQRYLRPIHLIQPDGRVKRMGRKDSNGDSGN